MNMVLHYLPSNILGENLLSLLCLNTVFLQLFILCHSGGTVGVQRATEAVNGFEHSSWSQAIVMAVVGISQLCVFGQVT